MNCIQVRFIDLPHRVHGVTTYCMDANGEIFYTILLNARDTAERHRSSYVHELEHISNCDFSSMMSIDELEGLRHHTTASPLCVFAE